MRFTLPTIFTTSLLLSLAAAEPTPRANLLELPAAVKTTIQREATGHSVAAIESEERDGRMVYRVRIAQEGIDKRLLIATDGTVLEVSDFPAVNQALAGGKEAGKEAWDKTKEVSGEAWDKTKEVAARGWEATRQTVESAVSSFKSDELTLNQVPRAPRATMEREAAGNRLTGIRAVVDGQVTRYHATITKPDGGKRTVTVNEDGSLVP
jgi:uncharacterized membrane protein YkoI